MKFRITCPKCNGLFEVKGEQGEYIRCYCPYCHHEVVCTLPGEQQREAVVSTEITQDVTENKEKKSVNGCIIFLIVMLFLLVCLLVGTFILVRLTQPERYGGL